MNQLRKTQRSITKAGYNELLRTSLSIKLPPILILYIYKSTVPSVTKYRLSRVATECVHSAESVKGVGRKEEVVIFQEQEEVNLIYTANFKCPVTNIMSEVFLSILFISLLVCHCRLLEQSVDRSHSPDAARYCKQGT